MPPLPSTSAQAARKALAERLRDLMREADLTGRELAARCDWHPSKTSRILSATTPASEQDIRAWCTACSAEDQTADLISALRTAEQAYQTWRKVHRAGMRRVQENALTTYERTRLLRIYVSNVIPGLLQTTAYASALLRTITDFQGTPDDVGQAVAARAARGKVLRHGDHRFKILIEEAVLRYRIADDDTMAAQLGYLLDVAALPRVSLGIVPLSARRAHMWPLEAMYLFDDAEVSVETLTALLTVTAPSEIATYERAFALLADQAVYGPPARRLITAAIDALR